jgi:hypothetical protein
VENPDVHVGIGSRGGSSSIRRGMSSHRRHYHPAAEEVDMSYEVGVLMDHSLVILLFGFINYCGRLWCS